MHVLVALRPFRGTLSAAAATDAVVAGWRRAAPGDELVVHPLTADPGGDGSGVPAALGEALADADLVVTGEGSFEYRSLDGTPLAALAAAAAARGVPCVVLAGQTHVGGRVALEAGIHGAYGVAADAESVEASLADPAGTLERLAAGVAAHWGGRDGSGSGPRAG